MMRNPIQTLVTHAEAAFDSFPAALGRALYAVNYAIEAGGMTAGKARATFVSSGHSCPLVVVSCMAEGPDLPDYPDPRVVFAPVDDAPDLEADGYSWGPIAEQKLAEPPC